MSLDKLNEWAELAVQKMNYSDFRGALNLTRQMQSLGPHYLVSYVASGLLIDIGNALKDEKILREGAELLQKDLEAIIHKKKYASSAYYNLANAHSGLFDLEKMKNPYLACFARTRLDQAKFYYSKAMKKVEDPALLSQILVNLGNCFDNLGRVIDALECYDKSLELNPNHGMALGNKGQALLHYAALSGEHQGTFIVEAYSLLSRALESGVPTEAISSFEEYLKFIKKKYPNKQFLETQPGYPGYAIKARSKLERFLIEFCLRNRLYLNICNFCQKCDAAIGDTAVIKKMIVPANKNFYLASSAYLNHIKQDFVTARFLLVLSRYEGLNLNFADKRVRITNTLDNSIHNIYVQLVKASFRIFYDILDKIAYFINDYLRLGIPERKIDFQRLWWAKDGTIRKEIQNTKNLSLSALFDISRDLEEGPNRKLRDIRNALTHRFVNVRLSQESEDEENMTENTLVEQTLELARIVRSSIIYLLHFVHIEESKKEARTKGLRIPMLAHDLRDNLKAIRKSQSKHRKGKG